MCEPHDERKALLEALKRALPLGEITLEEYDELREKVEGRRPAEDLQPRREHHFASV